MRCNPQVSQVSPDRCQGEAPHQWRRPWVSKSRRLKRASLTEERQPHDIVALRIAVANVGTLRPAEARRAQAVGQGLLVSGKIQRLEREFMTEGFDMVGVIETRMRDDLDVKKVHYRVIGSAADSGGLCGVQLWLNLSLRIKILQCMPVSPRILFVTMVCENCELIVGVLHSPINGSAGVGPFYEEVSRDLGKLRHELPRARVVLLTDMNAKIGSVPAPGIGQVGSEVENENGSHLKYFILEQGLVAVNTGEQGCRGDAFWTWTGSRGHHSRIDYLLLRGLVNDVVTEWAVNRKIELTESERDDHCVVQAVLFLSVDVAGASHKPERADDDGLGATILRASKEKLLNPALRRHFEWWIASFNVCDSVGIDDHLELLCQHVRNGSGIFKSDSNRGPKMAWISDRTWGRMCQRNGLKKIVRGAFNQMRTIRLVEMFVEWRDVVGSRKQRDLHGGRIWQNVACSQFASACRRWAVASLRLRRLRVQIQRSVKLDRNVMLDRTHIAAEKAGENGDMRKLFKLAKFASGTDAGRLRSVRLEDGSRTQSQEQYLDRFTDHFCEVLGADEFEGPGLPVESESDDDAEMLGECPCIERICKGISRLKNDKGLGFDGIGGELLKAGGFAMASALHKLNAKIWQQKRWPRRWRGGRLQELPKKGDNANVENYRGLLIGDHMGKVSSSILFDDYARAYEQYIPDVQCGATAGKGTDFASHLIRSVQAYTKAWGKSLGLLFLDLTKAYDRVIRELVFGWFQTGPSDTMRRQRGIAALRKLGLSSAQAHGIAREIAKGTILTEMGITGASAKLLKSMHSPSWFRMKGAKRKLVVRRGGRQGCLFGSILFNVVYGKALKEFYADCEAHGIPVKVRFSRGALSNKTRLTHRRKTSAASSTSPSLTTKP